MRSVITISMLLACSPGDSLSRVQAAAEVQRERSVLDSAAISRALAQADTLPRMRSLVIQWNDFIIGEQYYNGATAMRRTNIKSASKSIIAALTGIAIEQERSEHRSDNR